MSASEVAHGAILDTLDLASLSPDSLVLLSPDGTILAVNATAERMFGYARSEVVGMHAIGIVHPDDLWEAADSLRTTQRVDGVYGSPSMLRLRRSDGSYFTAEVQGANHVDDPAVGGVVIAIRDVSERREIAEALANTEETFHAVVRYASEGILLVDADARVQYVSRALTSLSGWRPEELLGATTEHLVHPDDLRSMSDAIGPAFTTSGAHVTVEFRLLHRSGEVRHCEARAVNLLDQPAVGRLALYVRDITERKAIEDALATSEQRFRSLVQHSSDVTVVWDGDGIVTYVSPSIRSAMGYEPGEGVGRPVIDFVHPDDRDAALRSMTELRRRPGSRRIEEIRMRNSEGGWRVFEVGISNLLEDVAVAGFVANARDVTDRKEMEAVRAEMEERFASAFENAPIGMALQDIEGRFLLVNRALCGLLDHAEEDLLRTTATALTHPDDLPDHLAMKRKVAAGEIGEHHMEQRFVRADGGVVWTKLSVSSICGTDGGPAYVVAHIEDITGRKRDQERLTHQALHDSLTGLPNRALLLDRLGHALERTKRGGPTVALLFCDLDRFKVVNDSLGHELGDRLLVQCADRLRGVVRAGDTVGRFGGDEFVVLCSEVREEGEVLGVAERISAALRSPFVLDGAEFVVSTSIGIAFSGEDTNDPADLLRDADAAMYRAKEQGRARWAVFAPEMRSLVVHREETERALRRAIEHDELLLHYQPLMRLGSEEIVGVEALVRWENPERGLVPPLEFIPLAEETGLIVPLGAWVLGEATRQLAEWQAADLLPGEFTMTVNLSLRQLDDARLVERVATALLQSKVDPSSLCLEITESALADEGEAPVRVLRQLRDLGVGLAIDDFGTGYSALSHLKRFPFDTLKIDRSFVDGLGRDSEDEAIVAAVVGVARALDLKVIAEGIETEEQLCALRSHGVTVGQGFLLGRPVPAADFVARLQG